MGKQGVMVSTDRMARMTASTEVLPPILCAPLIRAVDQKLLSLLDELSAKDWDRPTLAPAWTVRDVVAHLLDTSLRKLSIVRDGVVVEPAAIRGPDDLVALVNRLNREGVQVYRRLSPPVLRALLALACEASATFHEGLDPMAPAVFAVSWAGQTTSPNWFDTARELTERWHHQQQIREATNRPGILTRALYNPVLDCFMRGLPHVYRDVLAPDGTCVHVRVEGACGGTWSLERVTRDWELRSLGPGAPDAAIDIPEELAWRVFTRGVSREEARAACRLTGQESLAAKALHLTAIVA